MAVAEPAGHTCWLDVLKTQVCYQLIEPGSEWRLHRHWYEHSVLGDLLNSPVRVIADDTLYRCLDKMLAHKRAFFSFLRERWETLFQARFDVLLYDPDQHLFRERPAVFGRMPVRLQPGQALGLRAGRDRLGRDPRRVSAGLRSDAGQRCAGGEAPVHYLVGTPKGRLTRLEQSFVGLPWREVRESVEVKLLAEDGELYILAQSRARILKERGMRWRWLRKLWCRLLELRGQSLLKLGAVKKEAGRVYHLVDIRLPQYRRGHHPGHLRL